MASLDDELAAAYAAQEKKKQDLEKSKAELEQMSAQGDQLATRSKRIGILVIALCATVGSGILLIDPDSRPWGFVLLFSVIVGGIWSYFRNATK